MAAFIWQSAEYSSWDEFFAVVEAYCDETYQPLVKSSSKLAATANRVLTPEAPRYPETEQLKYAAFTYGCSHRGTYKSAGVGMKKSRKSRKDQCPAKIHASVDRKTGRVVVRTLISDHTHAIDAETYSLYPKQRLLRKEDEGKVKELLQMNVPKKILMNHAREVYGKNLKSYDIQNIKKRLKLEKGWSPNSSRTVVVQVEMPQYTTMAEDTKMAVDMQQRRKLIIDVDTGIDDAHAIMLALSSPSVEVVAITCANGNVKVDDVTDNTLRVLQICDRLDVPVYKGAARSLLGKVSEYENFTGGVAWSVPVDNSIVQPEHAANALVRLTKQFPGEITLVALAPLTNVALALSLDPEFPQRLRDVVIMGGNTDGRGRVSPCAEFNFFNDPEAAHVVLSSMHNLRILPFDTCCQDRLSWDFMEEWTGANTRKSNFLLNSLEFDVKKAKLSDRQGYRTCDGYAMATVVDPSIITKEETAYATVELSGQLTRAQMVVDWCGVLNKDKNVSLITGLDFEKIKTRFLSMI